MLTPKQVLWAVVLVLLCVSAIGLSRLSRLDVPGLRALTREAETKESAFGRPFLLPRSPGERVNEWVD